ncbi:uncharacterized protein C8orf88 homolog isoform X2 [Myripristis murdjan]|uniref:uncharacterized protein C8orf88 homolog isoform X2 n=1 Tax=Myripristis murdjan TaxID=586833 RepID=UPI001175FD8E|nr:uncharacterized protein C8orf88 homolog isoform X2 [Myripristis murdjan]
MERRQRQLGIWESAASFWINSKGKPSYRSWRDFPRKMEVSRRRVLQKHLEPARPLRRSNHIDQEPNRHADTCAQELMEIENQERNIGVEEFCKIVHLHMQKEALSKHSIQRSLDSSRKDHLSLWYKTSSDRPGRISYTRDVLIQLASSPVAKQKPEFLPEHPIVLSKAVSLVLVFSFTSTKDMYVR